MSASGSPEVAVGSGQAGLSMSWQLARRGIDHVVLEAHTAGREWTDRRWDSFCLVTPKLAMPVARIPVPGHGSERVHGARRDRRPPARLPALVAGAAVVDRPDPDRREAGRRLARAHS
ncbi:MAG TPA: hypothetical protein VIM10_00565 [Actinopolymorphaceae bacterium]